MKNSLPCLVPLVCFAVALPAVNAAAQEKSEAKTEKKELRVITTGQGPGQSRTIVRHLAEGEKELVTFLGVETSPVPPPLTAQLGLQEGTGLVVNHLAPDSPAAAALKVHDVLLKLDDQILIDQRQLAVLVRGHKEGDEVTLTYLRGGKQATAKVKLAKREMPKLGFAAPQPGGFGIGPNANAFVFRSGEPMAMGEGMPPEHVLGLMNEGLRSPGIQRMRIARGEGPGERDISVTVNSGNSHVTMNDDLGSLELTIKEGRKSLVAKNAKGEQVFAGPVNTPDERKAMPPEVAARFEKLEDSTAFSFKADSGFKTETKIMTPRGQGISAPLPHKERDTTLRSL